MKGRSSQPMARATTPQHPYQGPSGAKRNSGMNDCTTGHNTPGNPCSKSDPGTGKEPAGWAAIHASANAVQSTAVKGHPYAGPGGSKRNAGMNDKTIGCNLAYQGGGGARPAGAVKSAKAD